MRSHRQGYKRLTSIIAYHLVPSVNPLPSDRDGTYRRPHVVPCSSVYPCSCSSADEQRALDGAWELM